MKKISEILISTRTMAVLMLVYAFAMAYATFVENDYGTATAKAFIYESKWFEMVMFLLILNFIGNIQRYRLWQKEKWSLLAFHLSFILIFFGGAITRYISYEGIMPIREGETTNEIITDKNFFKIQIEDKGDILNYEDVPFIMTSNKPFIAKITPHIFRARYDFNGKKIDVQQLDYIQRKKDSLVANPNGKEYIHFVVAGTNGRENYYLASGDAKNINGTLVTLNRPIEGAIEFYAENGNLSIKTPVDATYMQMQTQQQTSVKAKEVNPLVLRSLYSINNINIVVPEGIVKGDLKYFEGDKNKDKNLPDMLKLKVSTDKSSQIVELMVEAGNPNLFKQITIDGLNIMLGYGAKVYKTPFSVKLDDFVMETYPGSNSPSAYESRVVVIDEGKETPHRIYMNNVLNYKGYRFFQSGFDPDRQGTRLSVNHDWWGTLITYIGYGVLFSAMFITFFWRGSQFWKLGEQLKKLKQKKSLAIVIILVLSGWLNAQHSTTTNQSTQKVRSIRNISIDEMISANRIPEEQADKFSHLLVQNYEGRIIPIHTQALEVLRKLYKKDNLKASNGNTLSASQWFMSININPEIWTLVPIIKIGSKGGDVLREKTKANEDGYTSIMNLYPINPKTGQISFVLEKDYTEAFAKKAANQTNYDKEVIAVNERVQIFNEFFAGQFLRIVPVKNSPNHRWNSWLDENFEPDMESQKVLAPYLLAIKDSDWKRADKELKILSDYQQKWGKSVVPSKEKVDIEILMNKIDINLWLLKFYSVIGGLLIILGFIELFRGSQVLNKIIKNIIYVGYIGYFLQFLGLIGRWYISGHAPWSNGYEAIVFISWVGITAGLTLYKNSNALIPASGFMVAVIMMGFAHGGSALDPQITPLAPVLKSYWLIIHVAIITASYGFFGLSFMIAFICLVFYILSNKKMFNFHNNTTIKELTIVSEMSMMIGLFALTIGTFIGGIWANESWGRYWSWDPKETWAFISIFIYSFVIHMRLVPGLRGRWSYHTASMFAISSVIMTYFGVNYYLSGLHSYAAGDPIPIPSWVYIGTGLMITLSLWSWLKINKLEQV